MKKENVIKQPNTQTDNFSAKNIAFFLNSDFLILASLSFHHHTHPVS